MAADALPTAMDCYFEDHRCEPLPSPTLPGEVLIDLPPSVTTKVLLLNERVAQQVSNSELAPRQGPWRSCH